MNSRELAQVITAAGWECREQRDEVKVRTCYFCANDKFNLELHADKGVYHCWACGRGGRLDAFLKALTGQEYHITVAERGAPRAKAVKAVAPKDGPQLAPLSSVPSAALYWERRGLSLAAATQYGAGVCVDTKHQLAGRIVLPLRDFWTADIVGYVGRSYTGRNPKYLTTLPVKMVTGWRVRDHRVPAVVVEGPFDGLAAHQAGFTVAVLGGTGTAGITDWAARLPAQTPVAVLLDGDAAAMAERLYWQLAPLRSSAPCVLVRLESEEDPSSIGQHGISEKVSQALALA